MTSPRSGWTILGLVFCFAGCGEGGSDGLGMATTTTAAAMAVLDGPPVEHAEAVEVADERRPAVVRPLAPWTWRGRVPERAQLTVGAALLPADATESEGVAGPRLEVKAELVVGRDRELLDVGRADEGSWIDLIADLSRYAGETVEVTVVPRMLGAKPSTAPRKVAWSSTRMSQRGGAPGDKPNVLFILVDTLRADHLTAYGYRRSTSPAIQAELADRGVVVETAYSQAPWTVPSVASLLTGQYPGEVLSGPLESFVVPAEADTMAERFQAMGYQTAAIYGNFVLRDANGFGQGFETRFTPPAVAESNLLHADTVNRRALPWLRAHQHDPFFLYVHYMDPHDPYNSPDLVDGRSPFFPDYRGNLSGLWIHGLYTGGLKLTDPERDLTHIQALYDSEIRHVDRAVEELLATLEPEVAANTLIVLTADHGEEFLDHGGWKHGQTLYQEQIHVPLIFRWDHRFPAGRRLSGSVQLLDLLPTLLAATGSEALPQWQGINLLPALEGTTALPRRAAFAQHLASGPLRAAVVVEGKKLMLFNREETFEPANALIEHLWRLDRDRMARQELYDLESDPGERSNLAMQRPELAAVLEAALAHPLDRALSGLRIMVSDLPAGSRLDARITFKGTSQLKWLPLFLASGDTVRWMGNSLELHWTGEGAGSGPVEKGLWLPGFSGGVEDLEARWEGSGGEALQVLLGAGSAYRRGPIGASTLLIDHRPTRPRGPALHLWVREGGRDASSAPESAIDPEVEKSLRALGYIQ